MFWLTLERYRESTCDLGYAETKDEAWQFANKSALEEWGEGNYNKTITGYISNKGSEWITVDHLDFLD